jgi:hypothetical protein
VILSIPETPLCSNNYSNGIISLPSLSQIVMVSIALTYVLKKPIDPLNEEVDEQQPESKYRIYLENTNEM